VKSVIKYLQRVQQQVCGESGAEIVEWVLWVGGIAILAGSLYTVLSGALSALALNIIGGMGVTAGS
jgi:hypothetical protein